MALPTDYAERVYAGVLGKLIGVYLGRPFEGWSYERIMADLGEVNTYVHDKLSVPLVVTDDDISGTFTFLRALPDFGNSKGVTPDQIAKTWLNYIIENETILWWGGLGNSTEHTAYIRLKSGIPAPESGSIGLNGKVVAEQIGSQIFIDGWAMVAPGDPEFAAELARRASSVSHDGEAIYGAQVVAAMEAQAFVEHDLDKLIDCAVSLIPQDSIIYRMIADIREWHAAESDWRKTRERIETHYGYDTYKGNCHMIPNHGLIIFSLLYGDGDFRKSQMIVNTSGWDTDCNAGNVGCLLGIKNGLAGLESVPDLRNPVADRLYLPTGDGGRAITDALTESYHVVNIGRALAGKTPLQPKNGAKFHFSLPGSVQGFQVEEESKRVTLENTPDVGNPGQRVLAIKFQSKARVSTPTFIPSSDLAHYFEKRGYKLLASPTLYSGQEVQARLISNPDNTHPGQTQLYVRVYGEGDELADMMGPSATLEPGEATLLTWTVPDTGSAPIAFIGLELNAPEAATFHLDSLTWSGSPRVQLNRPSKPGTMWKRAWVDALDHQDRLGYLDHWPEPYRIVQNYGRSMITQGTCDWHDYRVSARLTPHLCRAGGLAVRVQGLKRYYALICNGEKVQLVRNHYGETILAETNVGWKLGQPYELGLEVSGSRLVGYLNGERIVETTDPGRLLDGGGIGLIVEEGRIGCDDVSVKPI